MGKAEKDMMDKGNRSRREFTSMKNSPTSKVQQGFKVKRLGFSASDPNNITVVKVRKNV